MDGCAAYECSRRGQSYAQERETAFRNGPAAFDRHESRDERRNDRFRSPATADNQNRRCFNRFDDGRGESRFHCAREEDSGLADEANARFRTRHFDRDERPRDRDRAPAAMTDRRPHGQEGGQCRRINERNCDKTDTAFSSSDLHYCKSRQNCDDECMTVMGEGLPPGRRERGQVREISERYYYEMDGNNPASISSNLNYSDHRLNYEDEYLMPRDGGPPFGSQERERFREISEGNGDEINEHDLAFRSSNVGYCNRRRNCDNQYVTTRGRGPPPGNREEGRFREVSNISDFERDENNSASGSRDFINSDYRRSYDDEWRSSTRNQEKERFRRITERNGDEFSGRNSAFRSKDLSCFDRSRNYEDDRVTVRREGPPSGGSKEGRCRWDNETNGDDLNEDSDEFRSRDLNFSNRLCNCGDEYMTTRNGGPSRQGRDEQKEFISMEPHVPSEIKDFGMDETDSGFWPGDFDSLDRVPDFGRPITRNGRGHPSLEREEQREPERFRRPCKENIYGVRQNDSDFAWTDLGSFCRSRDGDPLTGMNSASPRQSYEEDQRDMRGSCRSNDNQDGGDETSFGFGVSFVSRCQDRDRKQLKNMNRIPLPRGQEENKALGRFLAPSDDNGNVQGEENRDFRSMPFDSSNRSQNRDDDNTEIRGRMLAPPGLEEQGEEQGFRGFDEGNGGFRQETNPGCKSRERGSYHRFEDYDRDRVMATGRRNGDEKKEERQDGVRRFQSATGGNGDFYQEANPEFRSRNSDAVDRQYSHRGYGRYPATTVNRRPVSRDRQEEHWDHEDGFRSCQTRRGNCCQGRGGRDYVGRDPRLREDRAFNSSNCGGVSSSGFQSNDAPSYSCRSGYRRTNGSCQQYRPPDNDCGHSQWRLTTFNDGDYGDGPPGWSDSFMDRSRSTFSGSQGANGRKAPFLNVDDSVELNSYSRGLSAKDDGPYYAPPCHGTGSGSDTSSASPRRFSAVRDGNTTDREDGSHTKEQRSWSSAARDSRRFVPPNVRNDSWHKTGSFRDRENVVPFRRDPMALTSSNLTIVNYIPTAVSTPDLFKDHISVGDYIGRIYEQKVDQTGDNIPVPITSFEDADLPQTLLNNLKALDMHTPLPVQAHCIPVIMSGRDLIACAQTGSGKTVAFLIPAIVMMMHEAGSIVQRGYREPVVLIIEPTRELAVQVANEARKLTLNTPIHILPIYGGVSVRYQSEEMNRGCDILIATPGRLLDFLERAVLGFRRCRLIVLDEADHLLCFNFLSVVRSVTRAVQLECEVPRVQVAMFSATFPDVMQQMARKFLKPDHVFKSMGTISLAIVQTVLNVSAAVKNVRLLEILKEEFGVQEDDAGDPGSRASSRHDRRVLVFVSTKRRSDIIAALLSVKLLPSTSMNGDRLQKERDTALHDFKTGKFPILVATSVCARGLDIVGVDHVINVDLPLTIEEYIHRIGRTGRVGNPGRATSFYDTEVDFDLAPQLVNRLLLAGQEIPDWLQKDADLAVQNLT